MRILQLIRQFLTRLLRPCSVDYISGADSTTTLKIAGDFTSVVSGSNLILTVGSDKITLAGAATLKLLRRRIKFLSRRRRELSATNS